MQTYITKDNFDTKLYSTLHIGSIGKKLYTIQKKEAFREIFEKEVFKNEYYCIGKGSNIVYSENASDKSFFHIDANNITYDIVPNYVYVTAEAGVAWDLFVEEVCSRGYGGVESLSAIPGSCGAAPIQNIGAYGVEISNCLTCVVVFNTNTGMFETKSVEELALGYRTSIWKQQKTPWIVWSITLKLKRDAVGVLYGYKELDDALALYQKPSLIDVRKSVIDIRARKLPNPKTLPNCGSYFTNPIIDMRQACELKKIHPSLPLFLDYDGEYAKVPAGWLLEHAGLKGYKKGNIGTYEHNALVVCNYGKATYAELIEFEDTIKDRIYSLFGITLSREVRVV